MRQMTILPGKPGLWKVHKGTNAGFHTGCWVGWGGKRDGSRMIVACESTLTHV